MHPLAETVARFDGRVHGARLGHPDGWQRADATATTPDLLQAAYDLAAAAYVTDRTDIRGNRLVEIWTWLVATPGAAALLLDRRVPDLSAANVALDPGLWSDPPPVALASGRFWCLPDDPGADHPDALVVPDEGALALQLSETLREHLGPLIEATATTYKRGRRALWRSATDQLIGAFTRAGTAFGREDEAIALARLAADGRAPLRGEVRIRRFTLEGLPPHTMHLRAGCCLYYRVDGRPPNCSNCPLIDDERRVELLEAELRAMHGD